MSHYPHMSHKTNDLNNPPPRPDEYIHIDYPEALPVSKRHQEIIQTIQKHQVVIICGTTGSGKTTQLPKMVYQAGFGRSKRIGITQPRRLAATGMAQRVAEETHTELGQQIGVQVRFENQTSEQTVIKFMTDGILLAETRKDRKLNQYDALIIDEAHERSLNIDFLLGYIKTLLTNRPDLKLIISSATLDADSFSTFFKNAPILEVEGRTYPVEDLHLPPENEEELPQHILRAINAINDIDPEGDILIFLPGEREIRLTLEKLEGQRWHSTEILPLYGRLSMRDQQRVFKPGKARRIILATNVAETSITIPRIHYVIDSGLVRMSRYNPRTQVQGLQIEHVSQASARQRRGRCGRITDGICIFLYSQETLENSPRFTDPEIRRTSLAGVILQMSLLHLPAIDHFPFIDPPQHNRIHEGYKTLTDIGALHANRTITPLGREMARLPIDPHLGRMLLQARQENVLQELFIITAFLSIPDVRERPTEKADAADRAHRQWAEPISDFISILNLWKQIESDLGQHPSHTQLRKFCTHNFINFKRVLEWRNLFNDLRTQTKELKWKIPKNNPIEEISYTPVHRSILAGIPANIGCKSEDRSFEGARNRRFHIFPGSALFQKSPRWVMTFALVETTRLYARICAQIDPEWLIEIAPHLCKAVYDQPHWDSEKGFVYARESHFSGGLQISQGRNVHYGPIHPPQARELFIKEALLKNDLHLQHPQLQPFLNQLRNVQRLEEKIRRPGHLFDAENTYAQLDQNLGPDVYSTQNLSHWLDEHPLQIDIQQMIYSEHNAIQLDHYPDQLDIEENSFSLIYTFDPGDELDGIALVCPSEELSLLPLTAPDWLVPGWLPEKTERLLKTLSKPIRTPLHPLATCAADFSQCAPDLTQPLTTALAHYLQQKYQLPIDPDDFNTDALPGFLRMKIIEMKGDEIIAVHQQLRESDQYQSARDRVKKLFSRWEIAPQSTWPGGELPPEIICADRKKTRGYPALYATPKGIGRTVYRFLIEATISHENALAKLIRITHPDTVKYIEKRPPISTHTQLELAAIDPHFFDDLMDRSIITALGQSGTRSIRDPQHFKTQADLVRGNLHDCFEKEAHQCTELLRIRSDLLHKLDTLQAPLDSQQDVELQLAFLFRPGFIHTPQLHTRYPRYLRALQIRLQRLRSNPQADERKRHEIEPFLNLLNDRLLQTEHINQAYRLIEFAMLIEEFRVNRFAPEIKTPCKISAQRLEEVWQTLQSD